MKNDNEKLKNFKLLTIIFIFSLFTFNLAPIGRAQSPSPEASPTPETVKGEKIKEVREAVQEIVRERLEEAQRGDKKAFTGKINEIANSTLILTTRQGEKQAKVEEETTIVNQARKEIEFEDLEVGSYVIAMGYLEDTNLLDAKRVVVSEEPSPLDREVVFGTVGDISEEEKILSVKDLKKNTIYTLEIDSKTEIIKRVNGETETIKFSEVNEGDRLVAIGKSTENEEKIITAKIIYFFLSEEPLPTEEPTPIASPTSAEEVEETE